MESPTQSALADKYHIEERCAEILQVMDGLWGTSRHSDVTIRCGGKVYKLHKAIISARSEYFAAICKEGFEEGSTSIIDLGNDEQLEVQTGDPELVEHMLLFFYRFDYLPLGDNSFKKPKKTYVYTEHKGRYHRQETPVQDFTEEHSPELPEESPVTHAQMYILGEYYGAPALKRAALHKFEKCARHYWSSPHFAQAVDIIYNGTVDSDHGLRDIVVRTIVEHEQLVKRPEIAALLQKHNELTYTVLQEKIS